MPKMTKLSTQHTFNMQNTMVSEWNIHRFLKFVTFSDSVLA